MALTKARLLKHDFPVHGKRVSEGTRLHITRKTHDAFEANLVASGQTGRQLKKNDSLGFR